MNNSIPWFLASVLITASFSLGDFGNFSHTRAMDFRKDCGVLCEYAIFISAVVSILLLSDICFYFFFNLCFCFLSLSFTLCNFLCLIDFLSSLLHKHFFSRRNLHHSIFSSVYNFHRNSAFDIWFLLTGDVFSKFTQFNCLCFLKRTKFTTLREVMTILKKSLEHDKLFFPNILLIVYL